MWDLPDSRASRKAFLIASFCFRDSCAAPGAPGAPGAVVAVVAVVAAVAVAGAAGDVGDVSAVSFGVETLPQLLHRRQAGRQQL